MKTIKAVRAWAVIIHGEITLVSQDWGSPPYCATIFKTKLEAKRYGVWTNYPFKIIPVEIRPLKANKLK